MGTEVATPSISISELVNKEPDEIEQHEVQQVADYLRKQRANFAREEKSAKAEGRAVRPSAINLSLEDLDL